jgi:hypothetical protein
MWGPSQNCQATATIVAMTVDERLRLAREAYASAIRAVRAVATPGAWRRLVRAAKNLSDAIRDQAALDQARWRQPHR